MYNIDDSARSHLLYNARGYVLNVLGTCHHSFLQPKPCSCKSYQDNLRLWAAPNTTKERSTAACVNTTRRVKSSITYRFICITSDVERKHHIGLLTILDHEDIHILRRFSFNNICLSSTDREAGNLSSLWNNRSKVLNKFRAARVIPDSVPDFAPTIDLRVKYGNINENLGNKFNVLQTLMEPIFSFDPGANTDPATTKYTYIQVDPDAPGPSLPLLRQFLHHIVYDVQPACIGAQTPKTQARYMALTPLSVQAHRYVSLLYRQPPNYTPPPLNLIEDVARAPFDLQKCVTEGKLVLVGGNFMREGLGTTLCALVPGCTITGAGYNRPKDGSALPDIRKYIQV